MVWNKTFKKIYLEHNLKEGFKELKYFDNCKPSNDNFIFGVQLYFFINYIKITWNEQYIDLALEIMRIEMTGDFEKMNYILFNNNKYEKMNEFLIKKILNSNIQECLIYGEPEEIYKSSMWVRYLDDLNFQGDNLTDEIIRQKTTY